MIIKGYTRIIDKLFFSLYFVGEGRSTVYSCGVRLYAKHPPIPRHN